MKDFLQWLWAVIRFIPAAIIVIFMFIGFYLFCKITGEPREFCARDDHAYYDDFDNQ